MSAERLPKNGARTFLSAAMGLMKDAFHTLIDVVRTLLRTGRDCLKTTERGHSCPQRSTFGVEHSFRGTHPARSLKRMCAAMCEHDRLAYAMLMVEGRSLRTGMSALRF
jgi:hypothetical protein